MLGPTEIGTTYHEVIDRNTANTPKPAFHISETDVKIFPYALFGDSTRHIHVQQVVCGDSDIFPSDEELIRSWHVFVEDV